MANTVSPSMAANNAEESNVLARSVAAAPERTTGDKKFLVDVGHRIRRARVARKMSRRALSELCGVSQRYLAQLEGGAGNISILLLHRVAVALDEKIEWLVMQHTTSGPDLRSIMTLLSKAEHTQRLKVLEFLAPKSKQISRANCIAFIGLRGAGKSTLGKLAAHKCKLPFLELNEEIERVSGMPVHEVMALYGNEGYRRLEMQSLKKIITTRKKVILAVAGGIVTEPETYTYLLRNCFTIWLQALPEEHMARVRKQGDERPMAGLRDAMRQLNTLLASRELLYAKADVTINTSRSSEEVTLQKIISALDGA